MSTPNEPKRQMTKPATELQVIARQYTGLLWQLKGNLGAIKAMMHRIPKQGLLAAEKQHTHPQYYANKLASNLASAINQLEYCEYLLQQLSQSHRDAYRYTRKLTTVAHTETAAHKQKLIASANSLIKWDRQKALDFITIYNDTLNSSSGVFNYEGIEFLVGYAKYMIKYFIDLGLITEKEGGLG